MSDLLEGHMLSDKLLPRWVRVDDESCVVIPPLFDLAVHCPRVVPREEVVQALLVRLRAVVAAARDARPNGESEQLMLAYYAVDFTDTSVDCCYSTSMRPQAESCSPSLRGQKAVLTCSVLVAPGRWRLSPVTWEEARVQQDELSKRYADHRRESWSRRVASAVVEDSEPLPGAALQSALRR